MLREEQLLPRFRFHLLSWQPVCDQVATASNFCLRLPLLFSFVPRTGLFASFHYRKHLTAKLCSLAAWGRGKRLSVPAGQSHVSLCKAHGSSCSLLSCTCTEKPLFHPPWLSSRTSVPSRSLQRHRCVSASRSLLFPSDAPRESATERLSPACGGQILPLFPFSGFVS